MAYRMSSGGRKSAIQRKQAQMVSSPVGIAVSIGQKYHKKEPVIQSKMPGKGMGGASGVSEE